MKSTKLYIALPIALGMVLTSGIAPGNAAHGDDPRPRDVETLTVDPPLFSPLSLATGRHNTEVYVTQNFAGNLDRITEDGDLRKVYKTAKKGTEVGAVSRFRDTLYFMEGTGAGEHDPAPNVQVIKSRSHNGRIHDIADVAKHEAKHNPDGNVTYGFRHVDSKSCLDQIKMPMDRPDKYKGSVDSHAYATAVNRRSIFVADAGANAVFRINKDSERVRTVAVLPATRVKITEELAREKGYDLSRSYAYSDSVTDVSMLETVGHAHAVNPDKELRKIAVERGWPVLVTISGPVPIAASRTVVAKICAVSRLPSLSRASSIMPSATANSG